MDKPFSQACERNKNSILNVLKVVFSDVRNVLEIGSGTGQHATYFSKHLPHLVWQPSDLEENLGGMNLWIKEASNTNLMTPFKLDVERYPDGLTKYHAVFAANILDIISASDVKCFFRLVEEFIVDGGKLLVYGPFNYNGEFTSESNRDFDSMLRSRDENIGIRDFELIESLASDAGFRLCHDHIMPANNAMLEWDKINK